MFKVFFSDRGFLRFIVFIFLMLGFWALLLCHPASAQTATGVQVDPNYWYHGVLALALAVINGGFLSILGTWLKSHFDMQKGSAAANMVDLLVTAGAQYATGAIQKAPTNLSMITVKDKAIGEFLNNLSDATQAAIKLKGTTVDAIAQRINGALVMALPPSTTTIVNSPSATTPAK